MKRRVVIGSVIAILSVAFLSLVALGSDAQMYLCSDKNGQNRVTLVQEGDEVWICVYDPDENTDCDVRDKIWTDIKLMDPKTGAYIVWISYKYPNTDEPGLVGDANEILYDGVGYTPYKGHYPGNSAGSTAWDYLEETGADTGRFVSHRSFQIGTRIGYSDPLLNTHVVDNTLRTDDLEGIPFEFQGGNWGYWFGAVQGALVTDGLTDPGDLDYVILPDWGTQEEVAEFFRFGRDCPAVLPAWSMDLDQEGYGYVLGLFSNIDTLVGLYQDQNDETDVALALAKIRDTEATISWGQEVYKDANASAMITVQDFDENLNCNAVEHVPVFILVNPGSWNPVQTEETGIDDLVNVSPTTFCALKAWGGVNPDDVDAAGLASTWASYPFDGEAIRWYNIYNSGIPEVALGNHQQMTKGTYYVQYATHLNSPDNVSFFDTENPWGFCRVMFYAEETGVNTGVFQLNLNSILDDLGFDSLRVRDVLVAYYLDPNDEDDFKLATAYIESRQHSVTAFTDENRQEKSVYWLGRDPVYVQVIDANANTDPCCPEQVVVHICDPHNEDDMEWLILDETSSNSPIFFTNGGTVLRPVWDALGIGETLPALLGVGGFQLWPDNWKIEAYNEDDIYARYNDVYYVDGENGMGGIGDADPTTALPPWIDHVRVANDLSFDLMSIADTQVYDGQTANMYFLDRNGSRVSGYVNSDCVFVEVIDPDQDEDQYRRERIDAYWDGGQNLPFGPFALNVWRCPPLDVQTHPFNALLGDTNIFGDQCWPQLYVLNPHNGRWAAIDLMENGVATGDFVSVICIDLASQYNCVPTLGVVPGDTIIAVYRDPSNHSDSCWISIKVGIGGGETPAEQKGQLTFVDAAGNAVANYTDVDDVYVKVVDRSHAGASGLLKAVEISGQKFDLEPLAGAANDTFITDAISMTLLGVGAGDTITAKYTDPTDPTDVVTKTITVIASELTVEEFIAVPNPFETEVTFTYVGSGIATTFSVEVRDLAGKLVWSDELTNVSEVTWDGKKAGAEVASGPYIYVIVASDGTHTFTGKGVFVKQ